MKKARAQTSPSSGAFWDKKLLEVEAKDPNRWRHSGYKSLYIDGSSPSRSRSRSFSDRRGSLSPRRARSPRNRSPRSPPLRARSPRSPPPRGRSPRSPPIGYRGGGRPRTPPSPRRRCVRRSASASSMSSCSDDSCSVCSPKTRRRSRSRSFSPPPRPSASSAIRKPPPPKPSASRPRPPSPSPSPPPRRLPRPMTPPVAKKMPRPTTSDRPTDPRTRPPPPPRPTAKPGGKPGDKSASSNQAPLLTRIKKEGAPRKKRTGSPGGGGESSGSEDSGISASVPIVATTTMTLSERFGKIAQWSADRERRDIENMRITKTGSNMKVMVEEDEFLYGSPPRRYSLSPIPAGHYPDELLPSGPSRLAAWDDVRVRYQYYKDLGYLRDLTLEDYIKWEEWWYKYQDWLANERHYEHWLATHGNSGRRRKKRLPASQRLGT
ncbi:uncharacterized protein LOC143196574 isoform X2 [Rhynchophorus ferrugineus]